jgi:hypothetical protein
MALMQDPTGPIIWFVSSSKGLKEEEEKRDANIPRSTNFDIIIEQSKLYVNI